MPQFNYFLSHIKNPVHKGDFIWSSPIPLNRNHAIGISKPAADKSISHGEYFYAARDFLERNRFSILRHAVFHHMCRDTDPKEIREIRIFLDKHGEFYHPAKVEVVLSGAILPFVLNVAISEAGKYCIQREYQLLKQLNENFPISFVPSVYGHGCFIKKSSSFEMCMFLGEWFEGFNEFHISFDSKKKKYNIVVWDHIHGNYFLTADQAMDLYRQAAKILTYYYDVMSFEQISGWNHAAGDFVLKCQKDGIQLKLITVRHYKSMFENNHTDEDKDPNDEFILEALLVFFLNMAIKMHLDRLDGVGKIVWSDEIEFTGILKGFLEGLAIKPMMGRFAHALIHSFQQHLLSCTYADLMDLNVAIIQTYHPKSPERPVIRKHLKQHVNDLYKAIRLLKSGA